MSNSYPLAAGDLPRDEVLKEAAQAIQDNGGSPRATVYFFFTCPGCGERCTFDPPTQLFSGGTCAHCGTAAAIEFARFALQIRAGYDRHLQ